MRINREIRNYIIRRVDEIKNRKIEEANKKFAKYEDELSDLQKKVKAIAAEAKAKAESVIRKRSKNIKFRDDWHPIIESNASFCLSLSDEVERKRRNSISDLDAKAALAVENIIVKLSLGGSAADLDALLSEVTL